MGCLIRLKDGAGYLTFNSEEAAKDFISKNLDRIEKLVAKDKDVQQGPEGFEDLMIVSSDRTKLSKEILAQAESEAFAKTREQLVRMISDDNWNTEEYNKTSEIVGVGSWLKAARDSKGNRVILEYINSNYLNNLTQYKIVDHIFGDTKTEAEKKHYQKLWFDTSESGAVEEVKPAKYWAEQINDEHRGSLSEDQYAEIDASVKEVFTRNVKTMLYGEVLHKIMEHVIKRKGKSINLVDVLTKLIDGGVAPDGSKTKGWKDKYDEHEGFDISEEIASVKAQFISETEPTELALSYMNYAQKRYQGLHDYFKKTGKTVEIIPESRLFCKLKNPVVIDGTLKNYIQSKLDVVVLVDGVPNIVDLKVSLSGFANDDSNAKSRKVFYTMAAYQLMSQKSGLPTGGGSFIEDVMIGEDGTLKSEGRLVDITGKVNRDLSKNVLEEMVELIETSNTTIDVDELDKQLSKLVDKSNTKARKQASVEKIAEKLEAKKQKDGTYTIRYYLYDDDAKKILHRKDKLQQSDIEPVKLKIAQDIVKNISNFFKIHFQAFKNNLKTFVAGNSSVDIFVKQGGDDSKANAFYMSLVSKYKNDCRVIDHPELDKLGIVLIETPTGIDAINMIDLATNSEWDASLKDSNLFDSIDVPSSIKKTTGAVNYLKTLLVINELLPKLNLETRKLNSIRVMRAGGVDSVIYTRAQIREMMQTASSYLGTPNNIDKSLSDPLTDVLWQFLNFKLSPKSKGKDFGKISDVVNTSELNIESIRTSSRQFSDLKTSDKILFLRELAERLEREFPTELNNPKNPQVSDVTILQQLIYRAIAIYENNELMCVTDESKWNLSIDSVDLISNQNMQAVRKAVNDGIAEISDRHAEYLKRMRAEIKKLKEGSKYGAWDEFLGHGGSLFYNMFRKGEGYEEDLVLKNPWTDDSLRPHEKRFLKFVLFTLNKYNNKSWKTVDDMQETDLDETSYYLPLARVRGIEKIIGSDGKMHLPNLVSMWEEVANNAQKIKEGFDSQLEHRAKISDTFKSIYNEFELREDGDARKELIDSQGGIDHFSYDIETVLGLFVVAMESADVYNNQVIPAVKGMVYTMAFQENETGTSLSNIIESSTRYMKSVVYDDTVYDREYQKYMRIFMPLRTVASNIALGFNLMNLPRELVMGMFTTISRSMFSSYGAETFSLKNYAKAWGTMMWDTKDFVRRVTKIELLNEHFRMTNMSISDLASQTTSNKVGFANVFNRWMGWTLVAPDYFNRMTMFIAQMMHDGSWDAYQLFEDDAEISLKYDMSKDKRFDIYYQWMKQSGGNLDEIPSTLRRTFLDQKSLYEAMKEEFNETLPPSKQIKDFKDAESDSEWTLPRAYTNRQRDSLKSFSDLCFGYYDKETKSEFYKTVIGVIFKQFMAFGSSKKMQYWKAGSTSTVRGEFKQLTTTSGELVYSVPIKNDDGTITIKRVTETELNEQYADLKDIAEKPMVWTGTFIEGVLNSYWNFFKSIGLGTKQALMGADESEKSLGRQLLRKTWKEYGTKGNIRHSNMLQLPWELFLSICFMWIIRLLFFEDPEQYGESYNTQLKKSSWGKQISYSVLSQATRDFNIFTTMQQHFFTWEIPTLSILSNVGRSFFNAFGDEDLNLAEECLKGVTSSVGMFKVIRPITELYFEEAKQN